MKIKTIINVLSSILICASLCACVAAPQLDKVKQTQLCDGEKCVPLENANAKFALNKIKTLISNGLAKTTPVCEANSNDQICSGEDIGMLVFAGPIPGRGAVKDLSILSVTDGLDGKSLKMRVQMRGTYDATPVLCSSADSTIKINEKGQAVFEIEGHYCNWAIIGNMMSTYYFVLDKVNTGTRKISAYYSIGITGTGNGSGSGYMAFTVPDTRLPGDILAELNSIKKNELLSAAELIALPDKKEVLADVPDAGRHVAIVIGNGAYPKIPLTNTTNDAKAMASTLERMGFTVTTVIDGDFAAMSKAIKTFLTGAQDSSIALIYYAGHGVEINGKNYLVATDVDISSPQNVLDRSVDVTEMLYTLGLVTKQTKVLILDACRDNPFPEKFKRQQQGLAQIEAPIETFIAFSTSPGKVAEDGDGDHSPYTLSLADKIAQPNASLEAIFRDVRKKVVSDTSGRQTPWENTSLTKEVRLSSGRKI